MIRTDSIDAPQKPNWEVAMHAAALILRGLVKEQKWVGTVGELVAVWNCALADSDSATSPGRC